MFRVRKIFNPFLDVNIRKMEKVKAIIREQFPDIPERKVESIGLPMVDPLKHQYQSFIFVAEDIHETVKGFALVSVMPDLNFCFLDYIAVVAGYDSSGLGGAIYQRVREEAESLKLLGVFMECLPDDPALYRNQQYIPQNQKRLAFYERFGARPIINTQYETPVNPNDEGAPYLVFDGLGKTETLPNLVARRIIRAILERKYADYCPVDYINRVVNSVTDEPVGLRKPSYNKNKPATQYNIQLGNKSKMFLAVNDQHNIHHVRERGYVESPVRVDSILKELDKTGIFYRGKINEYNDKHILEVHDSGYYNYFKKVCKDLPEGKSVYPYVFPIRNASKAPKDLLVRAGYYCIDTFTPLNKNAYLAARWGVNCALTAADEIMAGTKAAYVLTRPPGHHAERFVFGGFCYFNNCAVAANYLSKQGKVAILDIDYHHGNGQQQIFYQRSDVLTISIHGHPSFAYPYFSGFADEKGEADGLGFNVNLPLPEKIKYADYVEALQKAIRLIKAYKPDFLVIALGLDPAKGDPTGTWPFKADDFKNNGAIIGKLGLPTLIIQEGGYKNLSLGINARSFLTGFFNK